MKITIPIRTQSEANRRGHWGKAASRTKKQREATRLLAQNQIVQLESNERAVVTFTRIAPCQLDVGDNLNSSVKAVRDEVAKLLGLPNDRDPRVIWAYAQRKGGVKEYAVEIELRSLLSDNEKKKHEDKLERGEHYDPYEQW